MSPRLRLPKSLCLLPLVLLFISAEETWGVAAFSGSSSGGGSSTSTSEGASSSGGGGNQIKLSSTITSTQTLTQTRVTESQSYSPIGAMRSESNITFYIEPTGGRFDFVQGESQLSAQYFDTVDGTTPVQPMPRISVRVVNITSIYRVMPVGQPDILRQQIEVPMLGMLLRLYGVRVIPGNLEVTEFMTLPVAESVAKVARLGDAVVPGLLLQNTSSNKTTTTSTSSSSGTSGSGGGGGEDSASRDGVHIVELLRGRLRTDASGVSVFTELSFPRCFPFYENIVNLQVVPDESVFTNSWRKLLPNQFPNVSTPGGGGGSGSSTSDSTSAGSLSSGAISSSNNQQQSSQQASGASSSSNSAIPSGSSSGSGQWTGLKPYRDTVHVKVVGAPVFQQLSTQGLCRANVSQLAIFVPVTPPPTPASTPAPPLISSGSSSGSGNSGAASSNLFNSGASDAGTDAALATPEPTMPVYVPASLGDGWVVFNLTQDVLQASLGDTLPLINITVTDGCHSPVPFLVTVTTESVASSTPVTTDGGNTAVTPSKTKGTIYGLNSGLQGPKRFNSTTVGVDSSKLTLGTESTASIKNLKVISNISFVILTVRAPEVLKDAYRYKEQYDKWLQATPCMTLRLPIFVHPAANNTETASVSLYRPSNLGIQALSNSVTKFQFRSRVDYFQGELLSGWQFDQVTKIGHSISSVFAPRGWTYAVERGHVVFSDKLVVVEHVGSWFEADGTNLTKQAEQIIQLEWAQFGSSMLAAMATTPASGSAGTTTTSSSSSHAYGEGIQATSNYQTVGTTLTSDNDINTMLTPQDPELNTTALFGFDITIYETPNCFTHYDDVLNISLSGVSTGGAHLVANNYRFPDKNYGVNLAGVETDEAKYWKRWFSFTALFGRVVRVGMLAAVSSIIDCSSDLGTPIPLTIHPLTVPIGDLPEKYYYGAVICNASIVLFVVAVEGIFGQFVKYYVEGQTGKLMENGHPYPAVHRGGKWRYLTSSFPHYSLWFAVSLYSGTVFSAFKCFGSEKTILQYAVGTVLLFYGFGFPLVGGILVKKMIAPWSTRPNDAPEPSAFTKFFFGGDGHYDYVSFESVHSRTAFQDYRGPVAMFFLVELVSSILYASTTVFFSCDVQNLALSILLALHVTCVFGLQPFFSLGRNIFYIFQDLLLVTATVMYYRGAELDSRIVTTSVVFLGSTLNIMGLVFDFLTSSKLRNGVNTHVKWSIRRNHQRLQVVLFPIYRFFNLMHQYVPPDAEELMARYEKDHPEEASSSKKLVAGEEEEMDEEELQELAGRRRGGSMGAAASGAGGGEGGGLDDPLLVVPQTVQPGGEQKSGNHDDFDFCDENPDPFDNVDDQATDERGKIPLLGSGPGGAIRTTFDDLTEDEIAGLTVEEKRRKKALQFGTTKQPNDPEHGQNIRDLTNNNRILDALLTRVEKDDSQERFEEEKWKRRQALAEHEKADEYERLLGNAAFSTTPNLKENSNRTSNNPSFASRTAQSPHYPPTGSFAVRSGGGGSFADSFGGDGGESSDNASFASPGSGGGAVFSGSNARRGLSFAGGAGSASPGLAANATSIQASPHSNHQKQQQQHHQEKHTYYPPGSGGVKGVPGGSFASGRSPSPSSPGHVHYGLEEDFHQDHGGGYTNSTPHPQAIDFELHQQERESRKSAVTSMSPEDKLAARKDNEYRKRRQKQAAQMWMPDRMNSIGRDDEDTVVTRVYLTEDGLKEERRQKNHTWRADTFNQNSQATLQEFADAHKDGGGGAEALQKTKKKENIVDEHRKAKDFVTEIPHSWDLLASKPNRLKERMKKQGIKPPTHEEIYGVDPSL